MRGKVNEMALRYGFFKDHPRLCGEKLSGSSSNVFLTGSPPPMRGKVGIDYVRAGVCGITPAYAGKSGKVGQRGDHHQDHPRLCGEKDTVRECYHRQVGSPPPMRGKVHQFCGDLVAVGITPAYAGKSNTLHPEISKF